MDIEIKNIYKSFGSLRVLDGINLQVNSGELMALLGPSGSGKTTMLRVIAGLDLADQEQNPVIAIGGEDVTGVGVAERQIGFVFQNYALFRQQTVFENIAFGLRVRPRRARPSSAQIRDKVRHLLDLVQLPGLEQRYPSQLSGGQRQRIALARALAIEPKVLLLDEPFGALDAKVRHEMRRWLRRLHDEIHVTSILVTHDQEEALDVADRIVLMNHGRIEQVGTPDEVFHSPASEFVMSFLGHVNLVHGRLGNGTEKAQTFSADVPADGAGPEKLFVRSYDFDITAQPGGAGGIQARVVHIQSAGPVVKMHLRYADDRALRVDIPHADFQKMPFAVGDSVFLSARNVRVFPPVSGAC